MMCPTCNVALSIADRHSIEIDFCPKCRGVWLDRGELDKILERSADASASPAPGGHTILSVGYPHRDDDDEYDDDDRRRSVQSGYDQRHGQHGYPRRKRRSWLSDLFD